MATSKGPLRVGLLGCGRIARLFHLPILASTPGVSLVGVAAPEAAARAEVARRAPGTAVVDDYLDLVDPELLDAAVLGLPAHLTAEAARRVFEAGLHAYVEKPIGTSVDEGDRVARAWRDSGRVGMTGFNGRFHPVLLRLKDELEGGRIGDVVGVRTVVGAAARALPDWKTSRSTGGGALLVLAGHHVDLLRFLFRREVREISAAVATVRTEDDTAALTLTLEGGLVATIHASLAGVQESRIEVVGEAGVLAVDRYAGTLEVRPVRPAYRRVEHLRRAGDRLRDLGLGVRAVLRPPADPSYARALAAFVEASASGLRRPPDIDDGRRSLRVILAAEEAARTGRRTPVTEPEA